MRPLLVNTYENGGAAKACLRLFEGLRRQKVDADLLLKHQATDTLRPSLQKKIGYKMRALSAVFNLPTFRPAPFINQRSPGLEFFSFPTSDFKIHHSPHYKQANLINLHWVADFLDYPSFFKHNDKPLVWTLHDQNPFTGGEHYEETIAGIDQNGYPVKRKIKPEERKIFRKVNEIKAKALSGVKNLTIVAPSAWLAEEAQQSRLFADYPVKIIPNGFDTGLFQPRDRHYSRQLLNIPDNKIVVLFVAHNVSAHPKGFVYLQRALENFDKDDIQLLSVGNSPHLPTGKKSNHLSLGSIKSEHFMSIIYSAADVFVIPSLMDNLPNTAVESICCGTPVVGFGVGGIPDIVQDGENGYLTEEISVNALKNTLEKFFTAPRHFNRSEIRENAVKKYALANQAKAYKKLYESLL